jgi:hypothetical protein
MLNDIKQKILLHHQSQNKEKLIQNKQINR